ncbi:hypothetical protein BOTBODRAFT_174838 [Botryobasidium botryosum FD-172 SS1]|uniref:F-box domain-containing protein n=1 Tax=Botryobasidium botryosum (strain FD-172 SS1) TaxID=930990 RepID=A0A067MS26_BOTB1|nr:hypothetical protein BOTBODRAFT_174838 [Botryobasidium botryosum FD-172 SS1]
MPLFDSAYYAPPLIDQRRSHSFETLTSRDHHANGALAQSPLPPSTFVQSATSQAALELSRSYPPRGSAQSPHHHLASDTRPEKRQRLHTSVAGPSSTHLPAPIPQMGGYRSQSHLPQSSPALPQDLLSFDRAQLATLSLVDLLARQEQVSRCKAVLGRNIDFLSRYTRSDASQGDPASKRTLMKHQSDLQTLKDSEVSLLEYIQSRQRDGGTLAAFPLAQLQMQHAQALRRMADLITILDDDTRSHASKKDRNFKTAQSEYELLRSEESRLLNEIQLRERQDADRHALDARRRNQSESLIYRLPNETLSMIFELVLPPAVEPLEEESPKRQFCLKKSPFKARFRAVILLTNVSNLWRNIAIETPRLWNKIPTLSASVLEVPLHRSKCASLDVYWSNEYGRRRNVQDFAGMMLLHRHRIRSLVVHGVPDPGRLLFAPASGPEGSPSSGSTGIAGTRPPGNSLLMCSSGTGGASLRSFAIPCYSRLTRLHLYYTCLPTHTIYSVLRIVEASPLLQSLCFESFSCYRALDKPSEFLNRVIRPPHLRTLRISGVETWVARDILAHIRMPLSAKLHLRVCFRGRETLEDVLPLHSNSGPDLQNVSRIQALRISINQDRNICRLDGYHPDLGEFVSIEIILGGFAGLAGRLFPSVSLVLPSRSVEKLSITHPDNSDFVGETLAYFPAVKELLIRHCHCKSALMKIADPTLCPLLQGLHIRQSTIKEKSLLRLVEARTKDVGDSAMLQRLDVRECKISWRIFHKLKPLLAGLRFDGDDGESFESESDSD